MELTLDLDKIAKDVKEKVLDEITYEGNPFDPNRGNKSAYCRYLRYNVTGWYNLDSKEVRRRWQSMDAVT